MAYTYCAIRMPLTEPQQKLLTLLRERAGTTVTTDEILATTRWTATGWRTTESNGFYANYLIPIAEGKYFVSLSPESTDDEFAREVSQSRRAKQNAYSLDEIERLTKLTRDRAWPPEGDTPHAAEARRQEIDRLVRKVLSAPTPGLNANVLGARLDRVIGRGDFATVWAATRATDGQTIAIKVFDRHSVGLGTHLYHFRRGIRAIKRLNEEASGRPDTVVVLNGADDVALAVAMEYVEDKDLVNIAARRWTREKKIDVFDGICRGVEYAHERKIVHRDIKPPNVVMRSNGRPVLMDFDIADLKYAKTRTAAIAGTVLYSAPEELERNNPERATVRADIYSLGRLLYFLIVEKDPPHGATGTVDELAQLCGMALGAIIFKATAKEPALRYATVAEMREDVVGTDRGTRALGDLVARAQALFADATAAAKRKSYQQAVKLADLALSTLPITQRGDLRELWSRERLKWDALGGNLSSLWEWSTRWVTWKFGLFGLVLAVTVVALSAIASRHDWLSSSPDTSDTQDATTEDRLDAAVVEADFSEIGTALSVDASTTDGLDGVGADVPGATEAQESSDDSDTRAAERSHASAGGQEFLSTEYLALCREGDDVVACLSAARAFAISGNNSGAVELYDRGCRAGGGTSCFELGRAFGHPDLGQHLSRERARTYYELGCAADSAQACDALGTYYEYGQGGLEQDPAHARQLYVRACEDMHWWGGCDHMASAIHRGIGGPRDPVTESRYQQLTSELREAWIRSQGTLR